MLKRTLNVRVIGTGAGGQGGMNKQVQKAGAKEGPPAFEEHEATIKKFKQTKHQHDPRTTQLYKGPGTLPGDQRNQISYSSQLKNWNNSDRREMFLGTWKMTPGWFDQAWEPPLYKFVQWYVPRLKRAGFNLVKWGAKFTSALPPEKLYRVRRLIEFMGAYPNVRDNCFVAPSSVVIGDVTVGRKATVGYNAIIRGDLGHVEIGESATINDKVVIIGPSHVGKWTTVDPMCVVDQASVYSCSFIGSGTILGRGSVVESGSLVCAASVVNPGTVVPSGEIWSGQPAEFLGKISEEEQEYVIKAAKHMVLINLEHHDAWELTWEEMEDIRIGREWWGMWAQSMYEMRVKPFYVRDGPRVNRKTGREPNSPCERCEERMGMEWESTQVPYNMKPAL